MAMAMAHLGMTSSLHAKGSQGLCRLPRTANFFIKTLEPWLFYIASVKRSKGWDLSSGVDESLLITWEVNTYHIYIYTYGIYAVNTRALHCCVFDLVPVPFLSQQSTLHFGSPQSWSQRGIAWLLFEELPVAPNVRAEHVMFDQIWPIIRSNIDKWCYLTNVYSIITKT